DEHGAARRLALTAELPKALEHGDIHVAYQPVLELKSMKITSAEALARWTHEEHGAISPLEFVALAESHGLGLLLLTTVLNDALEQCRTWRDAKLLDAVAVNLSPRTLLEPDLIGIITRALERADVPASALILEITENAFVHHDELIPILERLRALGVRLAI